MTRRVIKLNTFYHGEAKIPQLPAYVAKAVKLAGEGNEIVLTGAGPIWLYLKVAHALHGKAIRLIYKAPNTESPNSRRKELVIFDHNAF